MYSCQNSVTRRPAPRCSAPRCSPGCSSSMPICGRCSFYHSSSLLYSTIDLRAICLAYIAAHLRAESPARKDFRFRIIMRYLRGTAMGAVTGDMPMMPITVEIYIRAGVHWSLIDGRPRALRRTIRVKSARPETRSEVDSLSLTCGVRSAFPARCGCNGA